MSESDEEYKLDPKMFTKARQRWIYQICAKSSKYLELLETHPKKAIPIVINTMKMFQSNFVTKREEMQSNWKSECLKHWYKSLDHKNFNFRLNEKKTQFPREFLGKLKEKMKDFQILTLENNKRSALEFFTGFEGKEIKCLGLKVDEKIPKEHPMLLEDPAYLEHFEKLPHFRFLVNDQEILRILIKLIFVVIENQSSNNHKQKDFFISFCKYFFNLGFFRRNLESFQPIDMSDAFTESLKDKKGFYQKFTNGELENAPDFSKFFFSKENEVISTIGTIRSDSAKNMLTLKSIDGILESEQDKNSDEEESNENEGRSDHQNHPYLTLSPVPEIKDRLKQSKFLPPMVEDQTLFYGTRHHYTILRFFMTLFERLKLSKSAVAYKVREDIKYLKEEAKIDVTKIEEQFEQLCEYRFK